MARCAVFTSHEGTRTYRQVTQREHPRSAIRYVSDDEPHGHVLRDRASPISSVETSVLLRILSPQLKQSKRGKLSTNGVAGRTIQFYHFQRQFAWKPASGGSYLSDTSHNFLFKFLLVKLHTWRAIQATGKI
jgi:hypothetical protein